jgi:hypothetical protein
MPRLPRRRENRGTLPGWRGTFYQGAAWVGAMTIKRIDLLAERDRIARNLRDSLNNNMTKTGYTLGVGGIPSPRMLASMDVEPVKISPADAARILELFDVLDVVHDQARTADRNFIKESGRIERAERAYRDPRVKNSKDKAAAAVRALGLSAKDPHYWAQRYDEYASFACFGKAESVERIAEREGRTWGAVFQGLKREVSRRRSTGEPVPVALPRPA